ncbi:MAG: hypothetical protein LBH75_03155 [Treponema sp.]|jgi:hypothetical protein|nr:hypothetical protein [Treponema sp.]
MKRHSIERHSLSLLRRKTVAFSLFLLGASAALSAQSIDGSIINSKVAGYANNASKLIPDVITMQNVWAGAPTKAGSFGLGVTANGAVFSMNKIDDAINGYDQFAGKAASLENFPDSILFLPAGAGEMRISLPRIPIDIGLTGMGYDLGGLIGSDSQYLFWTVGADLRVDTVGLVLSLVRKEKSRSDDLWYIPRLILIGGYYLSGMRFDFTANGENVWFDFKTDTYFLAAQVTENFKIIRLFGGIRVMGSGTNIQYGWETDKPIRFEGTTYAEGAKYTAPVRQGDDFLYFQVYGGLSLFGDFLTAGAMYNIITQHVGVSASVRLRFGG